MTSDAQEEVQRRWFDRQTRAKEDQTNTLKEGDGGGTSPPVSDNLKSRVDFLQTAFLWLAGIMVTGFIALVTVILSVNGSTNSRLDKAADTVSGINREVGQVGVKVDESNRKLERVDAKLDEIGEKLDKR